MRVISQIITEYHLTISDDVGEEIHLGVLLGQLERLVHTLADDQELDCTREVTQL